MFGDFYLSNGTQHDGGEDRFQATWSLRNESDEANIVSFELWYKSLDTNETATLLMDDISPEIRSTYVRPYPDQGAPDPLQGQGTYEVQVRAKLVPFVGGTKFSEWKTITGVIAPSTTTTTQPTTTTTIAATETKLHINSADAEIYDGDNTKLHLTWSWSLPANGLSIEKMQVDIYNPWSGQTPNKWETINMFDGGNNDLSYGAGSVLINRASVTNFNSRYGSAKPNAFRVRLTPHYLTEGGSVAGTQSDLSSRITISESTMPPTTTTTTTTTTMIDPDPIIWSSSATPNGSNAATYVKFNTTDSGSGNNLTTSFQNNSGTPIQGYKIIGDNGDGTSGGFGGTVTDTANIIPVSSYNFKFRLIGRTLLQGDTSTDGLYYDLELISNYPANDGTAFIRDVLFLPKSSDSTGLDAWTVKTNWRLVGATLNGQQFRNIKLGTVTNIALGDTHDALINTTTTTTNPQNGTTTTTTISTTLEGPTTTTA